MGVVGRGRSLPLFEGCLAVVQYSTVLYKERKEIEVVYTTDSIVNSLLSQKKETEPRNFTLDFFDKRSQLISNCEKVYLFRL